MINKIDPFFQGGASRFVFAIGGLAMINKYILMITLMMWSGYALAVDVYQGQYDVVAILPTTNGVAVELSPVPSRCTSSWWGTQFVIRTSTVNYETLVAAITSVMMGGKKISAIHFEPLGSGDCSNANELDLLAFKVIR